jgi:hypothetical protein
VKDEVVIDHAILVDSSRLIFSGEANQAKIIRTDFEDVVDGYVHSRQVVARPQCTPKSILMELPRFLAF